MNNAPDTYLTLKEASTETIYKEKGSKFYGYAFPILSEEDAKMHIETLKKKHHTARHWCYAWQLGTETITYRANDDGEPNNSAGMPIYGQIQSFGVTNVLVVVVRYFGGVKLGVGGLITAYKASAKLALEQATIIEKIITKQFLVEFDYKNMNKVMRIVKEKQLSITKQELLENCKLTLSVRTSEADTIENIFNNLFEVSIKTR
jgi:uncharacterized YigZ family protein